MVQYIYMIEKHPHGWYIYKERGETMGQLCDRLRHLCNYSADTRMTYAGRLDPLAEGIVLMLIDEGVMYKDQYIDLPKEYELDILFGYTTDTHDVLGYAERLTTYNPDDLASHIQHDSIESFVGEYDQESPAFSSKTVHGIPLFEHARKGTLPSTLPRKRVTIESIDLLNIDAAYSREALLSNIQESIHCVTGDFRQEESMNRWNELFAQQKQDYYVVVRCVVSASSGTYMRSLADRVGKKYGVGGIGLRIVRSRLGDFAFEKSP